MTIWLWTVRVAGVGHDPSLKKFSQSSRSPSLCVCYCPKLLFTAICILYAVINSLTENAFAYLLKKPTPKWAQCNVRCRFRFEASEPRMGGENMGTVTRRHALKAFGASAMASATGLICRPTASAVSELKYQPEKGATLRMLRWKRYVQGDEDQWLDNTRKFFELTGVAVSIENVGPGEVTPKAALAASVGAGPDIVLGSYDMPQLYPDKCLDLTEIAQYLGNKYGGWYDTCKRYCTVDGHWIALGIGYITQCLVYRKSMLVAAGFSDVPQDLTGFLRLCKSLKAKGSGKRGGNSR